MKDYVVKTEFKGKTGLTSVDPRNIQTLDMGVDKNIRIITKNGHKTFPIVEVIDADPEFYDRFERFKSLQDEL